MMASTGTAPNSPTPSEKMEGLYGASEPTVEDIESSIVTIVNELNTVKHQSKCSSIRNALMFFLVGFLALLSTGASFAALKETKKVYSSGGSHRQFWSFTITHTVDNDDLNSSFLPWTTCVPAVDAHGILKAVRYQDVNLWLHATEKNSMENYHLGLDLLWTNSLLNRTHACFKSNHDSVKSVCFETLRSCGGQSHAMFHHGRSLINGDGSSYSFEDVGIDTEVHNWEDPSSNSYAGELYTGFDCQNSGWCKPHYAMVVYWTNV